jgi:hypothetical protein
LFEDEHGMMRLFAAAGLSAALAMAGCSQSEEPTEAPAVERGAAAGASSATAAPGENLSEPAAGPSGEGGAPAAAGAPEFAVIYPGGKPKADTLLAQGPAGPGGRVEFTTSASPDEVVAFYRDRAEAAGLRSINTLSRDEVRGYAAGDGASGRGKLLNVVATPLEDGETDVLLMWSNGA